VDYTSADSGLNPNLIQCAARGTAQRRRGRAVQPNSVGMGRQSSPTAV